MHRAPRPTPRARALVRALALAALLIASTGTGTALAAAGDQVVVDVPAPVLPDDSAKPFEAKLSGNGRYVAVVESRDCTALPPQWDYFGDCYPEQHAWRYDLRTGARVKITKGPTFPGATADVQLSEDGSVAAWMWSRFGPDSDVSNVFRSEPDTGKAGIRTLGADGGYYPEFIREPSISADGNRLALSAHGYAGSCAARAYAWFGGVDGAPATNQKLSTGCDASESEYDSWAAPGVVPSEAETPQITADGKTVFFFGRQKLIRYDLASRTWTTVPIDPDLAARIKGRVIVSGNGLAVSFVASEPAPETGSSLWSFDFAADGTNLGGSRLIGTNAEINGYAQRPALSYDGQTVAFNWPAPPSSGLPAGSTVTYWYKRNIGRIEVASRRAGTGAPVPVDVWRSPSISSDGRFVTYIAADAKQAIPDDATPSGEHVIRVDMLGDATDTTAPAKPASIKVTQNAGVAQLSWPAVTDPSGPVLYRIRQRPVSGSTQSLVGTKVQTGTTLTLRGLAAGKPYRFAVTAEDAQGNRSTAVTVAFTANGTPDPTPPTITAPEKPYVGTAEQQLGGPFTIDGSDLANVTGVLVGNKLATGLTITGTKITGTAPRVADAASVPVTLLGPFGAKAAGRFYYRPPGTTETGD